jgi:acyl-phosphate glycerol 3-phosphate acyltransferase
MLKSLPSAPHSESSMTTLAVLSLALLASYVVGLVPGLGLVNLDRDLSLTLLASYLIGAIPFGYLVARRHGIDILKQGSGNIGATNVGRLLGRRLGLLVFVLDAAKGALPVVAAMGVGQAVSLDLPPDALPVAAGLAAFLGHLFPVYLRFRGGKGVATGAGVVAVLLPGPFIGALLVWLAVASASRYVSLASLLAAASLCVFRLLTPEPFARSHVILTLFCFLAALLVGLRHRANIRRLIHGTENRLPENPAMALLAKTLHVLALGLWFGTTLFFSLIVGLTLFGTLQSLAEKESDERPSWLPLPPAFDQNPTTWEDASTGRVGPPFDSAANLRREQGTRVAGMIIAPLFDWYFLLQGMCGLLALVTALGWTRAEPQTRVHGVRAWVLFLALLTVILGWPLERKVHELRLDRNHKVDTVLEEALTSQQPEDADLHIATVAVHDFAVWHLMSLFLNFSTLILVTVAMALAARMPAQSDSA